MVKTMFHRGQLLIGLAVFVALTIPTCTFDDYKQIDVIDNGLVAVDGQEIILAENTDTATSLWLLAGDRVGEVMGALIVRSTGSFQATLSGAVYVSPDGHGFTVILDANGFPGTITFTNGTVVRLTNYSNDIAYATLTLPDGTSSSQNVQLDDRFQDLISLIDEHGLVFDTSLDSSVTGNSVRLISPTTRASVLRERKIVLKVAGTTISVAACIVSLMAAQVVPPAAVLACTSAYAGLVSTIDYISDSENLAGYNPGDGAGQLSFYMSAVACIGLSPPECLSALLGIADAAIANCEPSIDHFFKRCYQGHVYWYNDCDMQTDPLEECPCGCEDGACKPVSACGDELTIAVTIQASPACIQSGETIYFMSSVSGGEASSYVYQWDFGDAGSSALDTDSHRYPNAGRHTVTLTVSDSLGNYGFAAIPVQIENCEQFLEAKIGSSTICTENNTPVDFNSRVRGGDNNYSYFWTFGDGETSLQQHPSHRFSHDGLYLVTLTVKDGLKNRAVDAFAIQIGGCSTNDDTDDDDTDTSKSTSTTTSISEDDESDDVNWDFDECYAMDDIQVWADEPSRYGTSCSAKMKFRKSTSKNITVFWFVEGEKGWWTTSFIPNYDAETPKSAWHTSPDGPNINTIYVTALYNDRLDGSIEGCSWIFKIFNEIKDRDDKIPPGFVTLINVEGLNPCP